MFSIQHSISDFGLILKSDKMGIENILEKGKSVGDLTELKLLF